MNYLAELSPAQIAVSASVCFLLLCAIFVRSWKECKRKPTRLPDIPMFGNENDESSRFAVAEGYRKFPDSPFYLRCKPVAVTVVPPFYLEEMKKMPESQVSFKGEEEVRFHPAYTNIGRGEIEPVIHAIQVNLTRDVETVLDVLQDEVEPAVARSLPRPCNDWTSVVMYEATVNLIATMSSRLFVGLPLSRQEEWLEPMRRFLIDALFSEYKLWQLPQWSLPVTARFVPIVRRTMSYRKTIQRLIAPLLKERLRQMQQPDSTKPNDILQTIIEYGGARGGDLEYHTDAFSNFALASIQNTAQALVHMLYDLAAYPEHVAPLREELETVLAAEGGKFHKSTMPKLRKLDSFMKESQRVNPPGLITVTRWVKQDTTFSDGITLPAGTFTAVSAASQNMDPRIWEDPERFDGFRFEKIRQKPGFEQKYQFVSTSVDALTFGHGSHPCPGRFFVNNEIKILLGHFLLNYDIRLEDGVTKRPENVYKGLGVMTDFTVKLMIRKRA